MAGRQVFSEVEKVCLRELIIKYHLNTAKTIGAGNPNVKKIAWTRLTEEYNSIEGNSKRTEAQLKKCWDNLKTRRKQVLALEKRERMKTGGGAYIPIASTSQSSQEIDDALQDMTDVEMRFACDSDSVLDESQVFEVVDEAHQAAGQSVEQESIGQELGRSVDSPPRQAESQLSDYSARATRGQGATNVRAHVITQEFKIRKEQYEELHKLKITEQEWLVKAAQEKYHKARLERESAEELLRFNQIQREQAELQILKNKE